MESPTLYVAFYWSPWPLMSLYGVFYQLMMAIRRRMIYASIADQVREEYTYLTSGRLCRVTPMHQVLHQ